MPGARRPADEMVMTMPPTGVDTVRRKQPGAKPGDAQPGALAGRQPAETQQPTVSLQLAAPLKPLGGDVAPPDTPSASQDREPKLHEPNAEADFEWISLVPEPGGTGDVHDHDHAAEPDVPQLAPEGAEPAMVEGVLCARNHFNDPDVAYCRQCGLSMVQQTRRTQVGQRPPLGVLLLDDGTAFTLDRDYVLGREPVLDTDVAAGLARPLRITDPNGTVGRVHLRVSLVGWQVEVKDLGSVNGSVIYQSGGGEDRLSPHEPVVVKPGTRIGIGQRTAQYLSYRAS